MANSNNDSKTTNKEPSKKTTKSNASTSSNVVKKAKSSVNKTPPKNYQKTTTPHDNNLRSFNKISKKYHTDIPELEPIITEKKIKKAEKIVFLALVIVGVLGLLISSVQIVIWNIDSKQTDSQIKEVTELVQIYEITSEENVTIIEPETPVPKENPYWDYIQMNLINVDFSKLKEKNSETKGWIQVAGTNINYPFVQTKDNDYYLKHSFDKTSNSAGWVFMDYRNNANFTDRNTIIYAHGRVDKTMFGSLKNILEDSWLSKPENFVVKTSSETENNLWQVFSVYKIPTTNDYIQVNFTSDEQFQALTQKLIARSIHNFNTEVSISDKILTLSTCYNDEEKVVLHAKLIKTEKK